MYSKRIGVTSHDLTFRVTWRHWSRDHYILLPYGHFLLVVLWNGVSISSRFRDIGL